MRVPFKAEKAAGICEMAMPTVLGPVMLSQKFKEFNMLFSFCIF